METKLQTLKNAAAIGDWKKAIAIAAKFQDLGKERNAILDAHTAYTNPRWIAGLGKCTDECVVLGIESIKTRYSI